MGRILTIAHHTVREAVRMKVVLAFAFLILALVGSMPFAIQRPNATLSSIVQTFLTWSLTPLGTILSFLAIFLGCLSISDEMYHHQIYTLLAKPLPRWQYVLGKWLGVVAVLTGLMLFAGLMIYGVTRYLASKPPVDEIDSYTLHNEVLTARGDSPLVEPDFRAQAERLFRQLVDAGRYTDTSRVAEAQAKAQLQVEMAQRWRALAPGEARVFEFEDLGLVDRSPGKTLQLRYKGKGMGYAQDEVLQTVWAFGDLRDADQTRPIFRRDVMDRYHIIPFPASCVSPNGKLKVLVQNVDQDRPDGHKGATIAFESDAGFEVLFGIGTFEGNMLRTLLLMWCRVVLIAGTAVFSATLVSYPVACLMSFLFYILAVSGAYVKDALGFGGAQEGVFGAAKPAVKAILQAVFWIWPEFSRYDGIPTFVDGRNVTLMWNLQALGKLVLLLTTLFLMAACVIFRRRQVAELSI